MARQCKQSLNRMCDTEASKDIQNLMRVHLTKLIVLVICFAPVWGQEENEETRTQWEETLLANNLSAISTVTDIVRAQISYSVTDEEGDYAKNLPELAEAGLIASELATGMQNGYQFATSSEGKAFTVNADPILFGDTGTWHFFADESGVMRWSVEGPATVFSPGLGESEPDSENQQLDGGELEYD